MRAPTGQDARQWCREVLAVRVQHGWTQQRLGWELGYSRWAVMRWEKGTQEPPQLVMDKVREWLHPEASAA